VKEPFGSLFTQGMVTHETYSRVDPANGQPIWYAPGDIERSGEGATLKADGQPVEIGRVIKMSKSKKNVVDPDDIVARYGADAIRWFMLSDSPPERDLPWSEAGIEGCARFVQRLWRLFAQIDAVRKAGTRRWIARSTRPSMPSVRTSRRSASTRPSRASTN
jgi:leucyl-tRNA synthetase